MMDVGMMLRNKHTEDEVMIVETYNLDGVSVKNSKLSTVVYVLEDKEGERYNWNAIYMKHWEIVKRKILFEDEGDEEE